MKDGPLRHKYTVTKTSGEPIDPDADYFVLRVDKDPYARPALLAYVAACRETHPTLAEDMIARYGLDGREGT